MMTLNSVSFKTIPLEDYLNLVSPFLTFDIDLAAVLTDGSNRHGPDEFNFTSLKRFWQLIRLDVSFD